MFGSSITIRVSVDVCLIGSIGSVCLIELSKKSNIFLQENFNLIGFVTYTDIISNRGKRLLGSLTFLKIWKDIP